MDPAPVAGGLALAIDELPFVEPDPAALTAICDPEPIQADPDGGTTTVFCLDGVVHALRAAAAAGHGTILRIYLQRPACAKNPCSAEELSTATVVAWSDTGALAIRLDSRLDTVSILPGSAGLPWPAPVPVARPAIDRPALAPAPDAVVDRTPYPYCGRATYDAPAEVLACFLDSVLLARPAEVIQLTFGTEGGELLDVVRFAGSGALTRYELVEGRWILQRGGLILPAPGGSWSFEPWGRAEVLE